MNQSKAPNQFDITGRLHEIYPPQQVSEKFRKREFILVTEDREYPEHLKFQLVQEKTSLLDNLQTGARVKVNFNLRGRMFNKDGASTNFTNLEAWRLTLEPELEGATVEASGGGQPAGGRTQSNSQL